MFINVFLNIQGWKFLWQGANLCSAQTFDLKIKGYLVVHLEIKQVNRTSFTLQHFLSFSNYHSDQSKKDTLYIHTHSTRENIVDYWINLNLNRTDPMYIQALATSTILCWLIFTFHGVARLFTVTSLSLAYLPNH